MAHRAHRRQAPRPAERDLAHPVEHPLQRIDRDKAKLPKRSDKHRYDDRGEPVPAGGSCRNFSDRNFLTGHGTERAMTTLLSVKELQARIAEAEGAKASAALKQQKAAEHEKEELLKHLRGPSGLSDDAVMEKASMHHQPRRRERVDVGAGVPLPHILCTDNGRAINQAEAGWDTTLTGIPKEIFEFWKRQLQPRGYPHPLRGPRLSRRHAGRYRHLPELGLIPAQSGSRLHTPERYQGARHGDGKISPRTPATPHAAEADVEIDFPTKRSSTIGG